MSSTGCLKESLKMKTPPLQSSSQLQQQELSLLEIMKSAILHRSCREAKEHRIIMEVKYFSQNKERWKKRQAGCSTFTFFSNYFKKVYSSCICNLVLVFAVRIQDSVFFLQLAILLQPTCGLSQQLKAQREYIQLDYTSTSATLLRG